MTDRQRNALGILLSVILGLVMMKSCAGGQLKSDVNRLRKTTRITVYRPIRIQARADAGWPVRQTVKYAAGTVYYGARALATIGIFL